MDGILVELTTSKTFTSLKWSQAPFQAATVGLTNNKE